MANLYNNNITITRSYYERPKLLIYTRLRKRKEPKEKEYITK
jgi:hypothetical protein